MIRTTIAALLAAVLAGPVTAATVDFTANLTAANESSANGTFVAGVELSFEIAVDLTDRFVGDPIDLVFWYTIDRPTGVVPDAVLVNLNRVTDSFPLGSFISGLPCGSLSCSGSTTVTINQGVLGGVESVIVSLDLFRNFSPVFTAGELDWEVTTTVNGGASALADPLSSVPLPAAAWLLLAGLGGLALLRRRQCTAA